MTDRLSRSTSGQREATSAGPALPVPERIGRYTVIDRLANGGMAEVFVCVERQRFAGHEAAVERLVVVKRILPHLAMHQAFVDMFLAEARFVARINHPNVVQIFELGEDNGTPFLSMEYVPGCSLRDLLVAAIEHDKPLPPGVAAHIAAQACAGAHAAHELKDAQGKLLGLVHRDISPHNLMVTAEGHVKLLDFGIAKATDVIGDDNTRTGALKGKVHYMAPEQCKQEPLDRRADIFALGIVAWELLARERLFKRESELDAMQAIVTGDLKDLRAIRKDVPTTVVAAVEKALQAKKETRFQTADAFRTALLDAARGFECSNDAVAAYVRPIFGARLDEKRAAFVKAAAERTIATGSGVVDVDGSSGEGDSTVVDKPWKKRDDTAALHPTVTGAAVSTAASLAEAKTELKPSTSTSVTAAPQKASKSSQALLAVGIAAASCALVVVLLLVVLPWLRAPTVSGAPLVVAYAPTVEPERLRADLVTMDRLLEKLSGRPVELIVQENYDATAQALKNGTAGFAILPPYLFVKTRRELGVVPLATKLVDGSSGSDGVLLVREESDITGLEGLRGKTLCIPDEKSTTGYMLPRQKLREAGLDPDVDVRYHRSGNHTQVLRDLTSGVCDAGATYSGGYLAADRSGIAVGKARQILLTGRSPQDVVVAAPSTPAADREALQKALLALDPKKELGQDTVGKIERVSGFVAPRLQDFEALEKAIPRD
jgi:phosphate/phosphite/phosphonate ABC transporter binding protein